MFLLVTHRSIIYIVIREGMEKLQVGKILRFHVSLCKIELNSE